MYRLDPGWGSHIPVLIEALRQTTGPVLELGMGHSSTILLHMLCADQGRKLISYDNDQTYIKIFRKFSDQGHEIKLVNWDEIDISQRWGVVLVDEGPAEQRIKNIRKLVNNADFLVLHDTEDPIYHYDEIYPLFKYRFDYTKFRTHATVLSNIKKFIYDPRGEFIWPK